MTSHRKSLANKRNASQSTGPRTLGGKLRSSKNAFRHGLATPLTNDAAVANGIDRLAASLATHSNDYERRDKAIIVSEAHFDLARIRLARSEVLARIGSLESGSRSEILGAVNALERIGRYEQRTRSKLRKGLSALLQSASRIDQ